MKKDEILKLYKQMNDASVDFKRCHGYPRKAPQARTMVKYINHVFGEFGYSAESKKVITSGQWLHTTRTGTEVKLFKDKKEVFTFSNVYGESNSELANFIIGMHDEYLPGFERDLKIGSVIDD